jgi:hypothetical protein
MTSKRNIPARRFIKPSFNFLIEKKRDGGEFTQEEIRYIIDSTLDGEMPLHQLAALAMAIYFSGMSAQETADLTEEMMLSGEVIDLSHIAKPKIDKYSTGGVGDKTALVPVPLAMASGVVVPMMCGVEHDYVINTSRSSRPSPASRATRPTSSLPPSSPRSAAPSWPRTRTSPRGREALRAAQGHGHDSEPAPHHRQRAVKEARRGGRGPGHRRKMGQRLVHQGFGAGQAARPLDDPRRPLDEAPLRRPRDRHEPAAGRLRRHRARGQGGDPAPQGARAPRT